jgi:hypothetical protein
MVSTGLTVFADGDDGARSRGRTGIELAWRSLRATPPQWWDVTDADTRQRVVRVESRWGFVPLPPGRYQIEAELGGATGSARNVEVQPGTVKKITPGDLGLGQLLIELPAARGIVLMHGVPSLEAQFVQDGVARPLIADSAGSPQITIWAREGKGTVRFQGGTVALDEPATVVRGATRIVPFDAETVAARHGLSLVSVALRDAAGKTARRDTQVVVLDSRGEHLLALTPNPPPGATWMVPPGPVIRARLGQRELVRRDLPVGPKAEAVFDFAASSPHHPSSPAKIQVDVKIESPPEGTVVDRDRTTLIGRASSTGPAGALRIALVADISRSADSSCGADLNGDGQEESIIQAEAAAGQLLLDELAKIDARTPGTAFEVAVVRFASGAETIAPLTRMTDESGIAALRQALDRIAREGSRGGTNYVAALDQAVRALKVSERPANCVVLFMSDGGPTELRPSLDASAKTGSSQVVIHTFGLGREFLGKIDPAVTFPPDPANPVNVLAMVAALGGPVGSITALPRPADVVQVIPRLPILELPEAELKEVQVVNETSGKAALSVQLSRDGGFKADVPVSLMPEGPYETNVLAATAIARDGVSKASDRVTVRCPPQPGRLAVRYRARPGGPPLPPSLMPACELILDSSKSMERPIGSTPKFRIAQEVMRELLKSLPDGAYVGLRLYGHLGFVPHRPGRSPRVDQTDPRLKTDSQLVAPISLLDRERRLAIRKAIDAVWPRGDTPLFYSLLQSRADFPAVWGGSRLVILVSDGEDNCGGKIEDVAAAFRNSGIAIKIHVVGFDIQGLAAKQQLEQLAEIGGGRYFDAHDAEQLAANLRQAVASVSYAVYDQDGKKEINRGLINGPPLSLMPGGYRIGIVGSSDAAVPVQLRNRQTVELMIDESGRLKAPEK